MNELSFGEAARRYLYAHGGEERFLNPLIAELGTRPLGKVNQQAVDKAARELYPRASAATINRQIYTPVAAVLRFSNIKCALLRPKIPSRRRVLLDPAKTHALLEASAAVDAEFGRLCKLLWWSDCRLSEALACGINQLDLKNYRIKFKRRSAALPPDLVEELVKCAQKGRLFTLKKGGQAYILLRRTAEEAQIKLPFGTGFDVFRARNK